MQRTAKILVVATCLLFAILTTVHGGTIRKRLDCQAFCKKTGNAFTLSVCKCGLSLFKRNRIENEPPDDWKNLREVVLPMLRHQNFDSWTTQDTDLWSSEDRK